MEITKGQLLIVKTPPYFTKAYYYEVTSAGDKMIRASLYNSPTVKKTWKIEEFEAAVEFGVVRLAADDERPEGTAEYQEPIRKQPRPTKAMRIKPKPEPPSE
ncbi:MAG: hypothetical protein K2Z81_26510 [Cyanobacteria bacterium]|nr:hypothetical protein [Cyanobacteriota bacterium]